MKLAWFVTCVCILSVCTPTVLGSCGCTPEELAQAETKPFVTPAEIQLMQQQAAENGWTFNVSVNPATQQSLSQLCGLVEPPNWWVNASFDSCLPTGDLPQRWDWREHDGVSSVKNQGGCGSCWAFGTIGPMESAILIHDKVEVDLSEQWLVSCNQDGWSCNGGWMAHDYHQWKTDRFNGSGAVLEEDFPYEAVDAVCKGPYHHLYHLDSWHYIGFPQGIPSVESIKQAIYTHGPVSSGIAVNQAFGGYDGGVFNNDTPADINHAVTLVGWDDTQGAQGVWILKNSWGPSWGEDGYMLIEYGCCKVGYGACYVVYPANTSLEASGGLLGLKVLFRNQGNVTLTDIDWKMSIRGGIGSLVNVSLADMISALGSTEVYTKRVPLFGIGTIQVWVDASPENAGRQSMAASGFLLGPVLFMASS
jgi:C1A family cysteine protease